MSEPLVSIVTPAYNVAAYLEQAIGSVRAQSYVNWEHLIVDDGSADDTLATARAAAQTDPRVMVTKIPHGGSSAARNAGLRQTKGSYVTFLDADDRWEPTFLRTMLTHLEASPSSVQAVFCRSWRFSDTSPHRHLHRFEPGDYSLKELLAQLNPTGNGSCLLLRADALRAAGPFREDLPSAVDLDMWLRVLAAAPANRFRGVPDVLTHYRQRTDSISADNRSRFDALHTILTEFGHHLSGAERRGWAEPIVMGLSAGRRREARELFWAARPLAHPAWLADRAWRHAVARLLLSTVGASVDVSVSSLFRRYRASLR